ncbi:hypothetical protein ACOJIV_01095 [Haloarcula sp. AONF1]
MATNESPSFDDLDSVEVSDDDNSNGWIDLEPGEEVTGVITAFNPLASYNGVAEIDGRPIRLNQTMRRQIIAGLIEGAKIGVRKSEETESFENDDGEEQEYNPREVRVSR